MILDAIRKSSNETKSIIVSAGNICRYLGHVNIRIGHFMLALLKHQRIRKLPLIETSKIGVDRLIGSVFQTLPPFDPVRSYLFRNELAIGERGADLPFTKASAKMLTIAMRKAEEMNSEYIEPEHLLLAAVSCSRGKLQKLLMKKFPMRKVDSRAPR